MKLFILELKDIYWAEKHLLKVLPKMEKAATTDELKDAFYDHLIVTEEQVVRLEEIFSLLEMKPQGKVCEGMKGITDEGEEVIAETEKNSVTRDAGLIIAAQKVEHYEIASYGSLVQLARTLGMSHIAEILEDTLEEEKSTDLLLTELAESTINVEAERE